MKEDKPLGQPSYGSIPLLPNSRVTPADHHCHEGQARIATVKLRDRHDEVIAQEKLDGSNVGVALLNGQVLAISRAGYLAATSPFEQHWHFAAWVEKNRSRFLSVLREGERLCGEWLIQAHGTRYCLPHEPLVCFDIMKVAYRLPYDEFLQRIRGAEFVHAHLAWRGPAISVAAALDILGLHGFHGAQDEIEGVVWRVQRKGQVDFLVKYLKPTKVDGLYLPEVSGQGPVWNWQPPTAAS